MYYTEAVAYIEETPKFTKKNKPENTWELLERIFRELRMIVVHRNGKEAGAIWVVLMTGGWKKE